MPRRSSFLRDGVLAVAIGASCAAAPPVNAQPSRSYAILSLASDSLSVIERVAVTGSQVDRNNRQRVPVTEDTFEVAVLQGVRNALPGVGEVALFSTRDPRLFALQDGSVDSNEPPPELVTAVSELTAKSNVTHLILVTKHSSSVAIPLRDGNVGDGKLAGLGFYLDRDVRIRNLETGETSTGFIAPFASLELTLIDTRTMRPVRHVYASRARAYEAAVSRTAGAPWDILTPSQKVSGLIGVLEAALRDAVPKVVAGD